MNHDVDKPMRIGIDLNPLFYAKTGIGATIARLVDSMQPHLGSASMVYPFHSEIPSKILAQWVLSKSLSAEALKRLSIQSNWGSLRSEVMLRTNRTLHKDGGMDLFHCTNTTCPYTRFEVPLVTTVYDLAWRRLPNNRLGQTSSAMFASLEDRICRSQEVLCISNATARDVREFLIIPAERITVTPLAAALPKVNSGRTTDEGRVQSTRSGESYFLAIGTLESRKNYRLLLEALRDLDGLTRLHLAGAKRGAHHELLSFTRSEGLSGRVRFLGHIDEPNLVNQLRHATALVMPSLYEGFGLPVLEAMAAGVPVVCSNAGALPEVGGDAAVYVDPYNIESIAHGMQTVLDWSPSQRQAIIERGYAQAAKFSWDKTAQKTIEVYRRVLSL